MARSAATGPRPTVTGLFAGIGGIELGLHRAGFATELRKRHGVGRLHGQDEGEVSALRCPESRRRSVG